jgi:N-acetylglucosaminyl-diphospho-decaprenol L-rhamnosyltransferase
MATPPEIALPPARCDLTISIVSLNTRDLLVDCLRSVFDSTGLTFDVVVVDNGSTDGSPEIVAQRFPKARLVRNRENRGFAAANNCALRDAGGRHILLLNPDTVVRPDTLKRMVAFMDETPAAGIAGPRIHFPDGRFQSCGYRFPTLLSEIRQSKNLDKVIRRVVGDEPRARLDSQPFETDWVDGACLLIRREAMEAVGLLDEQYFLYAEELDWCFRVRQAGWRVYALPGVEMLHYQGQSSAQMSDFSLMHLVETRLRYYRKHHGLASALATSFVYVVGNVRLMSRDRRKATVKLRATVHWWRSLLTV